LFKYMKMYKIGLLLLTSTQTSTIMSNRKYANKYTAKENCALSSTTTVYPMAYKPILEVCLCVACFICGPGFADRLCGCGSFPGICRGRFRRAGAEAAGGRCLPPGKNCAAGASPGKWERRAKRMMTEKRISPCVHCTRVQNPGECENKSCSDWRQWFICRWDAMRREPRQIRDQDGEILGVAVGGNRYAAPHQVRKYLRQDPCEGCLIPRDLCAIPCRIRRKPPASSSHR